MYKSRNSYSNFNSSRNYRGGNSRGRSQFSGRRPNRRQQGIFDPSMLVCSAQAMTAAPVYQAKMNFADLPIDELLKTNIIARGYQKPTPIQDQIIPLILGGKDVIGLASTGTGKTAAFLIPLIYKAMTQVSTRVLIMAPTRELAVQINDEFRLFANNLRVYSAPCIGGASIGRQIESLRRKPQFVIGTPGRLIDLEKRRLLNFNSFDTIVLDEVDQMFDMGFVHDMKYVIAKLPRQRHSLFFSATLPLKLAPIIREFLTNPIKVQVETQQAAANVTQDIVKLNGKSKIEVLHDLLISDGFDKVLVFGRTKHGLNKLDQILYERGFKVAVIHGNKSQAQRQKALRAFKDNYLQILLATDIAARGLDIDSVTHVINYDLPQTYEDYIHRIGRTGRADKTGIALSFVD